MVVVVGEVRRDHGRPWRRYPVQAVSRFVMGVDLGQSNDPTAISVIHHTVTPTDDWAITYSDGATTNIAREKSIERFNVVALERVPLGTPYPAVVGLVAERLAHPALAEACDLVIDETGVGRAVADIFETSGMRPQRVAITAGNEVTNPENRRWHVPKGILISGVDARLHTGELRFAAELTDAGALADELKDFRRTVSTAGRSSFNAREGKHDDLILSIAIALWWAARPRYSGGESAVVGLN
ncbi:hypothetical protein [Rhizobium sp. RCC_161_2]|uniref:hypothetical protein n=1 Tax=Rhizobium sp. RCC_161_2 TaxID=3239219 RepID=UPI0035251D14